MSLPITGQQIGMLTYMIKKYQKAKDVLLGGTEERNGMVADYRFMDFHKWAGENLTLDTASELITHLQKGRIEEFVATMKRVGYPTKEV